jgi:hypothetical protein
MLRLVTALAALAVPALIASTGVGAVAALPRVVPHAAPTPPFANGDTFEYAQTDTSVVTVPGQQPTTTVTTANAAESVQYPYSYGTKKNAYLLTTTVQDTSDANGEVDQDVLGFVRAGSIYALEYFADFATFYAASQAYGTQSIVYKAPYDVIAEYPESVGLSWTDNPAVDYKLSENLGSFEIGIDESQQGDGAYHETQTVTSASGQSVSQYDLQGNGTGTILEEQPSQPKQKYAIGLPEERGSAEVIPVELGKDTTYVPDWYPGGGSPLSPLADNTATIESLQNTPQACGSEAGQPAYDVRQTGYGLDPVGGEYVTIQYDQYDSPSLGLICSVDAVDYIFYDNLTTGAVEFTLAITDVQVLTGELVSPDHASARAPLRAPRRRAPGSLGSRTLVKI